MDVLGLASPDRPVRHGSADVGWAGQPGPAGPIQVYVQLRPRWAVTSKALASLDALIEEHPGVAVSVCGVSRDAKYLRVTLSIGLGPTATIARFSAESTAAYTFVSEIFQRLFDHAPCYVPEPTGEERMAAAALSRGQAREGTYVETIRTRVRG